VKIMFKLNKKAQSTAEYALVIALVIAAVVAMQVYVRRGLQGRMKDTTDYLATQTNALGDLKQYEPTELERDIKQTRHEPIKEEMTTGGQVTRTIADEGETTSVGTDQFGTQAYEKIHYNATE
jgi:Flp pilus assembly pilin Flp